MNKLYLIIGIFILIGVFGIGGVSAISFSANHTAENYISSNANLSVNTYNRTWLYFDPINNNKSYLTYNTGFNLTNKNWSIVLTYKRNAPTGATEMLYSTGLGTSPTNGGRISFITANNYLYFYWLNTTGSSKSCYMNGIDLEDTIWHDLALTYDSNKGMYWYLDGVEIVGAGSCSIDKVTDIDWSNRNPTLGAYPTLTTYNLNGSISRFELYNKSLTHEEISKNLELKTQSFTISDPSTSYNSYWGNNGTIGYGLSTNRTFKTFDYGYTWIEGSNIPVAGGSAYGIWSDSNNNVFAGVLGSGSLYRTGDGNISNWTQVLNFTCEDHGIFWKKSGMAEDSEGNLYLGEYSNGENTTLYPTCAFIYKSIDNGVSWSMVYNGSETNSDARHIHFIQVDPYTDYIYASQGDSEGNAIIRSIDKGVTWVEILNKSNQGEFDSHPIEMSFFEDRRIFSTDAPNLQNGVMITYDDENFEWGIELSDIYNAPVYAMTKDNYGNVFISTADTSITGKNGSIWYSQDKGDTWTMLLDLGLDKSAYSMSNANSRNEIFYIQTDYGARKLMYQNNSDIGTSNSITILKLEENNGSIGHDKSNNANNLTIQDTSIWRNDGLIVNTRVSVIANLMLQSNVMYNPLSLLYKYFISSSVITTDNYYYFLNTGTSSYELEITDGISALVYNTNGSVLCGGLVTGNCNITLPPNNASYVLDNYNIVEGVTRTNDPIRFSFSSDTSKHIASSLVGTIQVPVTINIGNHECSEINQITYTTNTGDITTWSGVEARKICSNGIITFSSLDIDYATNSNEIEIEYGTTSLTSTILKILVGFLALSVLGVALFFIVKSAKDNFDNIDVIEFFKYAIIVLIAITLYLALINYIVTEVL